MDKTSLNNTDIEAQSLFDLIFPKEMRIQAGLSDQEASLIYNMWKTSPVGATQFSLPTEVDRTTVSSLKTKGYLSGFGAGVELTDKGKKVIVEMVTCEPNSLDKQAQELSYNTIKAQTNRRPKQAFIKKQASKSVKSFNLKRNSLEQMKNEDRNNG